tara:strand:- start:294 stop:947 length:654 start_codon:yes stop_codon:yes gene_type:complete
MAENSKTSAQMGRENRQKIINALKKIFRFDKNITKALKDSPKATVKKLADGTFDKGVSTKQKTNKVINDIVSKDKKEMSIKDQLSSIFSTSRNPNVAKDLTPIAKKPKVKSSMTQKEAARKRKSLLQTSRKTPDVSITIASIGIPKSRPKKLEKKKIGVPKSRPKSPTKKTQTLVFLKSGKKGTIAQRLAELDKEKALEKVKKVAQASLKKKKTRKA